MGETLFGKEPARLKYCTYRKICYDIYTMCILGDGINMEIKDEINYVFRLLAYRIKMEKFAGKEEVNEE